MERILQKLLSLLLACVSLTRAQWPNGAFSMRHNFRPLSGSEGPCGFGSPNLAGAAVQNPLRTAQRPGAPANAPQGQPTFSNGLLTDPFPVQQQQNFNQQPQQRANQQQNQGFNTQPQQRFNTQPQQRFNTQPQQGLSNQQLLNGLQFFGQNQQMPGSNLVNPLYGRNLADVLGLPPGMTVNQARILELDANNPYDLDIPEQGSMQPGMNVPASGQTAGNAFFGQRANPVNVPQRPVAPPQSNVGGFNNVGAAAFVYGSRIRCQCDHAGDCNAASSLRGMNYKHQCMPNFVCCCRAG